MILKVYQRQGILDILSPILKLALEDGTINFYAGKKFIDSSLKY
jgi:hypothetical protein